MLYVLGIIIALAVLGPLFGSDSRDGLDWTPRNFWLRRRASADPVKTPVVPDGRPGTAPRRAPPGRFQQPDDPVPMTGESGPTRGRRRNPQVRRPRRQRAAGPTRSLPRPLQT